MSIANIASILTSAMAHQMAGHSAARHTHGGGSAQPAGTNSTSSANSSTGITSLSSLLNVIPKSSLAPASSLLANLPGTSGQPRTNIVA